MDRIFKLFSCFVCFSLLFGNSNSAVIQRTEETVTIASLDSDTLALPSTTEPLFDCKGKKDGTYPDYHRACRVFFLCQSEILRVFWCQNGTVFNPESGHCDLPSKVRCVNPDRRGWLPLAGECLELEDGVYVNYGSYCRNFYFCSGGLKTSFTCPEKTLFDWQTGFCRPSQHVSCSLLSCDQKENGFHVDFRSGCKRYYLCDDRRKTEFVCPQGTVFNSRLSRCTDPKGVRCRGDEPFNCNGLPDGYYPDHHSGCRTFYYCHNGKSKSYSCPANTAFNSNTLACDQVWKTHCERAFSSSSDCSSRPDGVYPKYETNCREFLACRRGLVHQTGVCPPGKLFSPVTGLCQPSSLVICASVKDPDCDSRSDGMYPDSGTGCAAFYVCLNGRRVLTSYCSSKTLYDVATGTCLPSPLVTCNATSTIATSIAKLESYDCRGRVGLYPDFDGNCRGYFVCAFGHKVRVDCPLGTGFNAVTKRCESAPYECRVPTTLGAFRCLTGDEGIYPTSNCKRWHECWDKVGYTYECPARSTFDLKTKSCQPNLKDATCVVSDTYHNLDNENGTRFRETDFSCDGRINGVYPSTQPGDCQSFHICAEGKSFSSKCPTGFVFDLQKWHCVPSYSSNTCGEQNIRIINESKWSAGYDDLFSCQSKSNGMYPDIANGCSRYFVCENGRKTTVYCPDGERFDRKSMVCVDAELVRCEVESTEATTQQPLSTYASKVDRNDVSDKLIDNGSPNSLSASFGCPSDVSGFFPDFTSGCRNFHICFNGVRRTYSCPSLLLFNPVTKICDLSLNVECVPRYDKPTYNCTSEGDEIRQGLYPDYHSGCSRYYACSEEGNPIVYTCSSGKIFDYRTQTCDVSEKVECQEGNVSGSLYHAHGVPKRFVFHCLDKEDGFYPDYARHCHVFYRCIKGKKVSHYCKPGLLFNPKVGICDFEENVVCAPPT